VGSYISGYLRNSDRISDDEQRPEKEVALMPTMLSTTVKHIYDKVPNSVNSKLIEDFYSYTKGNSTSERHQNNNLKAIIAFAGFLGPETTFYQVSTMDQITSFLDCLLSGPTAGQVRITQSGYHLGLALGSDCRRDLLPSHF
jgi:hypothetical protein